MQYFTIDKRGVIRAKTTLPKQAEYSISVIARDTANTTASLPLMFYDALDNVFPVFQMNETRFSIAEDKTDYFVTKVFAYSPEQCTRYSIASGNHNDNFQLDPFKGELIA